MAYSLRHANRTISGVEKLVGYPPRPSGLTLAVHCKMCPLEVCQFVSFRVNVQVSDSALALNQTVEENLVQLETAFQEQTDYVSIVQKLQGQLDELVRLMADVPFWSSTDVSLEDLARKTEAFDFYRLVLSIDRWIRVKSEPF